MSLVPSAAEEIHEAWMRSCRVDELLSRFNAPPNSLALVQAVIQRIENPAGTPFAVIAGHGSALSAPQWAAAGEVVQRQIGLLFMLVSDALGPPPGVISEIHMVMSAAAASLSLTAWRAQAESDQLTGLRNALGLQTDLDEHGRGTHGAQLAMLDLDGLKKINDDEGHDAGNELIRRFANRLRDEVHDAGGRAYRPHGDEFVAILATAGEDLALILGQIEAAGEFRFSWGIAKWPDGDPDIQTVLRQADQRMYEMKTEHKSNNSE